MLNDKIFDDLRNRFAIEHLRLLYNYYNASIKSIQGEIAARMAAGKKAINAGVSLDSLKWYQNLKGILESERIVISEMLGSKNIIDKAQYISDAFIILESSKQSKEFGLDMARVIGVANSEIGRAPFGGLSAQAMGTMYKIKEYDAAALAVFGEKTQSFLNIADMAAGREIQLGQLMSGIYRDSIIGGKYDYISRIERTIGEGLLKNESMSEIATALADGPYSEWRSSLFGGGMPTGNEVMANAIRAAKTELSHSSYQIQKTWAKNNPEIIGVEFNETEKGLEDECSEIDGKTFIFERDGDPPDVPIHPNCQHYIIKYIYKHEAEEAA
jgi:hypothetical protein